MEKKRIALWDNLKCLLILLVVLGHFLDQAKSYSPLFKGIFIYIYSFHMPLFLFIAGHFHKNENIGQKALSYLTLGFVLKYVTFITRSLLGDSVSFTLLSETGLPWYMFAMAAFNLLTFLLKDFNQTAVLFFSVLLACFAGYDPSINSFLILSRIIVFFPFYFAGSCIDMEKFLAFARRIPNRLTALAILFLYGVLCIRFVDKLYPLRPLFTGQNPFSGQFLPFGCLWRLLCYAISAVLSFSLISVVPSTALPLVTKLGQRTLQVYFWHRPILYVLVHFNITDLCITPPGEIGVYRSSRAFNPSALP